MANSGAPVQILNDGGFEEKGEMAQMVIIKTSTTTSFVCCILLYS